MTIGKHSLDRGIVAVDTLREPVRLCEGLDGDALDSESLQRGWQALSKFGQRLKGFHASRVRAVATNTVRVAANAHEFLAQAEERLGFSIDVISGHEEARLVYAGVAHALPRRESIPLVVDIGGGSTELVIGRGKTPILTESLPIGSGTLTRRFFPNGVITSQAFQQAEMFATREVEKVASHYREHGWEIAIGSSGSARALAKVLKTCKLNDNDQPGISYQGLLRLSLRLLEAGHIDHLYLPDFPAHRKPVLPGGLAIMLAVFKALGLDQMVPSGPALRLGVLHTLVHGKHGASVG